MPEALRLASRRPEVSEDRDPAEIPEVLVISALLDTGTFDPSEHGLHAEQLTCWEPLWAFASDYQAKEGRAPAIELVRRRFPSFPYLKGIGLTWAAGELIKAATARSMRRAMQDSIRALNEGDHNEATRILTEVAKTRPATTRLQGLSIFDEANVADEIVREGLPFPWPTLQRVTSGIMPGELVYVGGRTGQGKSWVVPAIGLSAAVDGARVRYISLEMPAKQINHRLMRLQLREEPGMRRVLFGRGSTVGDRRKVLATLRERVRGEIDVVDMAMANINMTTIDELARDVDLLCIDHMGLMSDAQGRRSIEDWRVAALISNVTKEVALKRNVPIIGAVQINREGDRSKTNPPKLSELAQTTALEQDADVVITLRRRSETVLVLGAEKARETPGTRWYTTFDPGNGDLTEISKDTALIQIQDDEDRVGDA